MVLQSFAALLALASAVAPHVQNGARPSPASQEVVIAAAASLDDVIAAWVEHSDDVVTFESSAARQLATATSGLVADLSVPVARLQPVVESLLALHGFGLTELSSGDAPVFVVHLSNDHRLPPLEVSEAAAGELGDHPALRVRVTAPLDQLDSRQLPTVLRPMFPSDDQRLSSTEGGVVVEGRGACVSDFLKLLDVLDASAADLGFGASVETLFPRPSRPLELGSEGSLLDVVKRYGEIAGVSPAVSAKASVVLRDSRPVTTERSVLEDDVHAFVSDILHAHGLTLSFLCTSGPLLLGIQTSDESAVRRIPLDISLPSDFERHAALQVLVSLRLSKVDTRRLPTTLRPLFPDGRPGAFLVSTGREDVTLGGCVADLDKALEKLAELEAQ